MDFAISADGTRLAYDHAGDGPSVVIVLGAFGVRGSADALAAELAARFTVFTYDRRGRGDSGDTDPYAVEREIEDLDAILDHAGGNAAVLGHSSGAVLALHAAAGGSPITELALYEPPFIADATTPRPSRDLPARLLDLVADGRRGDAVELFQRESVGLPADIVAEIRHAPFRPGLETIAHTTAYDATITADRSIPDGLASAVAQRALVLVGSESDPSLHTGAQTLAALLPHGRLTVLDGQGHAMQPTSTAAALSSFLLNGHSDDR